MLFATSGHSGVDRIVSNLLPEFGRANADFDLLTIRKHGPYIQWFPENMKNRRLPAAHRNTVLPSLVWYLRQNRPAVLLTASHRLNRAALLAREVTRVPTRITIRMGMTLTGQAEAMGARRGRRLFRSMQRWYPKADAVIVPSQGLAEEMRKKVAVMPERLHFIENPIVTPELSAMADEPVDDPWLREKRSPVILAVGSLEPRKDFATLLRAFARLRNRIPCRLIILGEGGERRRLEALAKELDVNGGLRLPGYELNPYRYMRRADAFVLSSRREGSGAVLVEALACGTPVVATDCPVGPAEILRDGEIGPLVAVGDEVALASAIEHVLVDPHNADVLRNAAEPFRSSRSAARYLAALGLSSVTAK